MKKPSTSGTAPALQLARLSTNLENIADSLARAAAEFGIEINDAFPCRVATIAFGNGVVLSLKDADATSRLEGLLVADSFPHSEELIGLTPAVVEAIDKVPDWTRSVGEVLNAKWLLSADNKPPLSHRQTVRLRVLHGIRFGLVFARERPDAARTLAELIDSMWTENRFLASWLLRLRETNQELPGPAFVEFTAASYPAGSFERRVIRTEVAEIYQVAKTLDNPWKFSFWVEVGYNNGRAIARDCPEACKRLLTEASPENLKGCHLLFRRCVLGTASSGVVQMERATLRFLGEHSDTSLARRYCTGEEPRRLARIAYDFSFWMGIFASYPVPEVIERKES